MLTTSGREDGSPTTRLSRESIMQLTRRGESRDSGLATTHYRLGRTNIWVNSHKGKRILRSCDPAVGIAKPPSMSRGRKTLTLRSSDLVVGIAKPPSVSKGREGILFR